MTASRKWVGIFYIVAAFFFVAVMGAISKYAPNLNLAVLAFFQSFVALLLVFPWIARNGIKPLKTARFKLHVLRGAAGLISQVLMFFAVRRMPLMNAVLLANSAPIFINLIFWLWLKQKSGLMNWVGLFLGFAGIVLVLKPGASLLENPASLVALSSAIFSAGVLVVVDQLSKTESSKQVLLYYFLVSSAISAPFAFYFWREPSLVEWLSLVGIGVAMALAQLFIVLAYKHASAGIISPFNYSVVVFSGLLGWLLWSDVPDLADGAGVLLVIAGGVISIKYGAMQALKRKAIYHAHN